MRKTSILAVFLMLFITIPAYALYLEIPASTVNQAYILNIKPPMWFKITLKDMVPNTAMDNIALTFRGLPPEYPELLHVYIKTNGEVLYATSTIQPTQLGTWNNGTEIYIGFYSDKIVLSIDNPISSLNKAEVDASVQTVYDVRVHSNDDISPAYLAGSIILEETVVYDPSEASRAVSSTVSAMFPLLITMVSLMIPLTFLKFISKILSRIGV